MIYSKIVNYMISINQFTIIFYYYNLLLYFCRYSTIEFDNRHFAKFVFDIVGTHFIFVNLTKKLIDL